MRGARRSIVAILACLMLLPSIPALGDGPSDPSLEVALTGPPIGHDPCDATGIGGGSFTENLGQWASHVRFVASTSFGEVVLGTGGVTYDMATGWGGHRVKVAFDAAGPVEPMGIDPIGSVSNYLYGADPTAWVAKARSFQEVLYEEVWPGVDVRYYFQGASLKYDVIVAPEADVSPVRFDVQGHQGLEADADGLNILIATGKAIRDGDLVAHYADGEAVEVAFEASDRSYGFSVEKEPGRELVIDPLVLPVSTLVGGSFHDQGMDVEQDADGNIYVAGTTQSADYPVTTGAYSVTYRDMDLVVTKLDWNCSQVLWSTFIGGSGEDLVTGLELDEEGNVHLLGETQSADFPVTDGALQATHGNRYAKDLYVLKLSSDGSSLEYSTFIGGLYGETAGDIKVHDGRAYVAGTTESADFPHANISGGIYEGSAFIFIFSRDGTRLDSVMSWPGSRSSIIIPASIHVDGTGNVTMVGMAAGWEFPTTPGAYIEEGSYMPRGFVLQCDPDANVTIFATYFGYAYTYPTDVTLDSEGYVYLTGTSMNLSNNKAMDLTEGAYRTTYKGRTDAFITKMDPKGTHLIYSTLVGGNSDDAPGDLEVTNEGRAVSVGWLRDGAGYQVSSGCLDPDHGGTYEGFVLELNENGTGMVHSTYLGGDFYDQVTAAEITDDLTLLVTGSTDSKGFPVTEGAFQGALAGNMDIFVSEMACLYPPSMPRNLTATGGEAIITLDWEAPEDDGGFPVTSYQVLRGPTRDEVEPFVVVGNVTGFQDLEVEYDNRYYYSIQAFNGKGISPRTAVVSARPMTLPDPPANLTGTVYGDRIVLEWDPPAFTGGIPILEYKLYRGTSGHGVTPLEGMGPNVGSYTDIDLVDRTTYVYELAAINVVGESRERATVTLRATGISTPPQNLSHTYGDRFIRLAWGPPEDDYGLAVDTYNVYRRTGEGPGERIAFVPASTPWFVDVLVEYGTVYTYAVTAVNAKGESDPSEEMQARTTIPPDPPTGVKARAHEDFVRVTWSPPGFDGASPVLGYRVHLGGDASAAVCLGSVNVAGVEDPQLVFLHEVPYDGVVRRYFVTAVNAEGESGPSDLAETQTYQVPGAPRSLQVARGDGQLSVTWLPPETDGGTPVTSYILYRRAEGEEGFEAVRTLAAGKFRFVDADLDNGVTYTYRVTASNIAGEGNPSPEVEGTPAGLPAPPSSLAAAGLNGSARLSWEPPEDTGGLPILGYRVFGVSEDLQVELVAEVGADHTEFVANDLENGGVYVYAVRAMNELGGSELSEVVEARPMGPPGRVEGLVAFWDEDHVLVAWSAPVDVGGSPVTSYMVRRHDWDAGVWTEVGADAMAYVDSDVEWDTNYTYAVYAVNGVDRGPSAATVASVPEEPVDTRVDEDAGFWPYLAAALAAAVVLMSVAAFRRRPPSGEEDGGEAEAEVAGRAEPEGAVDDGPDPGPTPDGDDLVIEDEVLDLIFA